MRKTFEFPLHDTKDYKGRIKFKAVRENYDTLVEKAIDLVPPTETTGGGPPGTGPSSTNITFGNTPVPSNIDLNIMKQFTGTELSFGKGTGERVSLDTVSLYLPSQITMNDAAQYDNVDLGIIGGAAAMGIRNREAGLDIAKQALNRANPFTQEGLQSIVDVFQRGLKGEAAQVAALRTVGRLNQGLGGAIETETGITLNPNRRSTFKGIGLRRFNFSFQMIPTSAAEARRIKEIIGFFRHNMYPETGDVTFGEGTSVAFKFPSKFDIVLLYDNKKVGTTILPCFLEAVNVTYNPNSMAFHTDGEPQETLISLGFIEERALTKGDVIKENNAQNLRYMS